MRSGAGRLAGAVVAVCCGAVFSSAADSQALIGAARAGDVAGVRANLGADVNATQPDGSTALHWAAYNDNPVIVDLLLKAGAKVSATNQLGVTPLYLACENGGTDV